MMLAVAMLVPAGVASAQPAAIVPFDHLPALAGHYFPIESRATGHRYHIYVRTPEGYDENPERRYPIVHLLDGDSLFPLIAPTCSGPRPLRTALMPPTLPGSTGWR